VVLDRLARFDRAHPLLVDGSLSIAFGSLGVLNVVSQYRYADQSNVQMELSEPVAFALVWLCVLPLAARRVAPVASFLGCMAGFIVTRVAVVPEPTMTFVAVMIAYVSVGVFGSERMRTSARIVGSLAFVAMYVGLTIRAVRDSDLGDALWPLLSFDAALSIAFLGGSWVLGDVIRSRGEQATALRDRTLQLDEQRRTNAERAVVDERLRIARELHDVLAHHVSVMGVQAAAAGRVLDRDPDRAREALGVIESSSRDTIDELRRLVGFLRFGTDEDGPQPGLARLDELVADATRSGIDIDVRIDGSLAELPAGVDLSAFRVVQEALTNARKHAHPRRIDVVIERRPDLLSLTVTDDGRGPSPFANGTGLGLVGMRERVRLHEGSLETGAADGQLGYRVLATFPLRNRS
jgi:signal transduction histidine kinase